MSPKNERNLIYMLALICLAVGVFCYAAPTAPPETPVRRMFMSVGGNVLFSHQTHSDTYSLDCAACHHNQSETGTDGEPSCGVCHTADGTYVPALGEGGKFDHDAHGQDLGLACSDCHHEYQEGSGSEPQMCGDCHEPGGSDQGMPNRKQAFHRQCIGCHEDSGVKPGKGDCTGCHGPRKRADAFHKQCIGCHEEKKSGPAGGDANCILCHGF